MARRHRRPNFLTDDRSWNIANWRSIAAVVYLSICVFDFVLVPIWVGWHTASLTQIIADITPLSPQVQTVILNHRLDQWQPLTLGSGGLFHIAFGAILGVTAWSTGRERITEMRNGGLPTDNGPDPDVDSGDDRDCNH
jgi:hypothetical protein